MPRRSVKPPPPGRPLAEQLRLSYHAIEPFRRRAPELAADEPRARLADLVEAEGVVLAKPPFLPPVTEAVPLELIENRTFGSRVIYERYWRTRAASE